MDPIGTISEGEWSCLSGMYTSVEADFMAQLLGNCPMTGPPDSSSNNRASSGFYWPNNHPESGIELGPNGGPFYDSHELVDGELVHFLQPSGDQDSYYIADKPCPIMVTTDHGPMSMEFCVVDASNSVSYLVEGNESSIQENVEETSGHHHQPDHQDRAKLDSQMTELEVRVEEPPIGNAAIPRKPKKRCLSSLLGDNARSDKRNGRSSKNKKLASGSSDTNKEENNAGLSRPASSSCLSEDDSNGSYEHNGGETQVQALNLSRKTRAGRGAATDPQSLYARKRREKINERLKILQSLVPNGTKVDISTMLEEAVLYVKFLQLQIKLLSSDETWMYAPIAYNGMDIGLNLR